MRGNHDHLIDDVARDLTRGEPSPQLRQSVRARIETRRAWWIGRAWLYGFASAAALVIVAVMVGRALSGSPGHDRPRPSAITQAVPPAVRVPLTESAPSGEPGQSLRVAKARPRAPRISPRPEGLAVITSGTGSNDPNDSDESGSVVTIAPLIIEPLALPPLTVGTSSGMMPMPIDIAPLQIEPLQPE